VIRSSKISAKRRPPLEVVSDYRGRNIDTLPYSDTSFTDNNILILRQTISFLLADHFSVIIFSAGINY
jgi:hypothetical protein